ncbi:MAG TPA: hypothetical protein VJT49_28250 [Amycolatopsis sp.]|uniref:hypothetical protein n=1 Tax=Amycolatopsis sp. TaxID=37632 RepID=UPI002B4708A6|nr:hypothetical protein [Amycolatopsis sp.]HKS48930.1 hypothetical protein [Amycolatopsis sp.]
MAGSGDKPAPDADGSSVFEPLNRGLFRQSALAHYERWGGDPAGAERRPDGGSAKRWWRVAVTASLTYLVVLGLFSVLVQVPVFVSVPVLLVGADGVRSSRVVAVFPESAAGLVRRGTTVQVPAADGMGTVGVAVSGDGSVLTVSQVVAVFPALAGAGGLPARGVLAQGTGPSAPGGRAFGANGGSVVVTARGRVADRPLIWLVSSTGLSAGS